MKKTQRTGPVTWLFILLATIGLLVLFKSILWLVIPMLLAIIYGYMLSPVAHFLMNFGLTHRQAVAVLMILVAIATFALLLLWAPELSMLSAKWENTFERYINGGHTLLSKTLSFLELKFSYLHNIRLNDRVSFALHDFSTNFAEKYLGVIVFETLKWIPSLLLVPYLTYFLLIDGPRLKQFLIEAVPNAFFEKTLLLCHRVDLQLRSYFLGMLALTFLDAITLAIGLAILGVTSPILLGITTAILAWLPYIGSLVGCLIVVLVTATDFPQNPEMSYGVLLLFIGVRMLDEFFYLPMTVGKTLRIHPVVCVLMLFMGGAAAGVSGLFLVIPVLGIIMVIGEVSSQVLLDSRLRARYKHARQLRIKNASAGLEIDT